MPWLCSLGARRSVVASLLTAVALVLAAACSESSASSPTAAGSCAELASRCHSVKTTLGVECHELGHDGDDAKCAPRRSECLAECPDSDDGASPASDAGDAAADALGDAAAEAGADPCVDYCACMLATCATDAGTTFGDGAMCLAACRGFQASDVGCYASHCEAAKTAADPEHDCEHASGEIACH